ncbi:MAG TPA: hypothetical protein VHE77_10975, partial [Dongiaceae bacterium]|nr:hypothetical protein [Dongiaceae bacterium]
MTQRKAQAAFAALLLGTTGFATAAAAQTASFPPGTNCMILTPTQQSECLSQQQGTSGTTTVPLNGGANVQNPTSANPSTLTG